MFYYVWHGFWEAGILKADSIEDARRKLQLIGYAENQVKSLRIDFLGEGQAAFDENGILVIYRE